MKTRKRNQKKSGEVEDNPILIESDPEIEDIVRAKKKVKKCSNLSEVLQYSKIPLVPEVHLTKEDLEGDPIQLLMKMEKKY